MIRVSRAFREMKVYLAKTDRRVLRASLVSVVTRVYQVHPVKKVQKGKQDRTVQQLKMASG